MTNITEATFQGKEVPLNKPMKGDVKKSKVYVDPDGDGKAQKVNFGDKKLSIKKDQPSRKKSYCARSGGIKGQRDVTSANYWSRRAWNCEEETQLDELVTATAVPPTYQPTNTQIERRAGQQARGTIAQGQTKIPVRSIAPTSRTSGVGTARLSQGGQSGGGYNTLKPTTTDVKRNISNRFNPSFGQQGASAKVSSVKGTTSFSQGGTNIGTKMAKSSPSQMISKMSDAGRAASVVSKAAPVASRAVGAALRVAGGPAATAAAAVMSPTPAGAGEDEKKRQNTLKSFNPYKAQGRSTADYEKQALTPKTYEAPKAANPKVDAPTPPSRPEYFTRGQAFQAARSEAGGGSGKFSYQSGSESAPKSYQTNVSKEPYKPESQLKQTSIKENKMDSKEKINEAIDCILENNLNQMKETLSAVLQEKAMKKLEEKKKDIAASYFAQ